MRMDEHLVHQNKRRPEALLDHAQKQISSSVSEIHLLNSFISGTEGEIADNDELDNRNDI